MIFHRVWIFHSVLFHSINLMKVSGLETIAPYLANEGYFVKGVVTDAEAIFFPGTIQHRDVKREGVSYEDDYQGNAMAFTVTPGKFEIRFHQAYPDARVRSIFQRLLTSPDMEWASRFEVQYQGRLLLG